MSSKFFWKDLTTDVTALCKTSDSGTVIVLSVTHRDGNYYILQNLPLLGVTTKEEAIRAASEYYCTLLENDISELTHELNELMNDRKQFKDFILQGSVLNHV